MPGHWSNASRSTGASFDARPAAEVTTTRRSVRSASVRAASLAGLSLRPAAGTRTVPPGAIRWILAVTPTAFRQRLTSIRKALGTLPPELQSEALALAYVRDPARSVDLQFGLVRRALKAALGGRPGLATHDADGHLLVIRNDAHTRAPRGNG